MAIQTRKKNFKWGYILLRVELYHIIQMIPFAPTEYILTQSETGTVKTDMSGVGDTGSGKLHSTYWSIIRI